VWLALADGTGEGGTERILVRLEAIARFTEDIRRRWRDDGVDGIAGALELSRRLQAALAGVSRPDLDRTRAEGQRLQRWLGQVAASLRELERLKRIVGRPAA